MNPNDPSNQNRRSAPGRSPRKRSLSSRMGLQKAGSSPSAHRPQTPQPPAQTPPPRSAQRAPQRPSPNRAPQQPAPQATTQINPQKAGYRQGAPRQNRRITQAEQLRRRNQRRLAGIAVVLAAMIFGIVLSINLLFKITAFRIENFDRSTPANTGIYSEDQILAELGLQVGDKLFFSTAAKNRHLQSALPYLDDVQVNVQMPGTVVVKVHPAIERFAVMYSGGWLVLSDTLKILRVELSQPEGLILLQGSLPASLQPVVGQKLSLQSYNSLLALDPVQATAETARATADETLEEMLAVLEGEGLLDGVTVLDASDLSGLKFTYQGRVEVLLGGTISLDYKLRMAAAILLDTDKGLAAGERGTLDVSQQQSGSGNRAYFQPNEPEPTPSSEEVEEETTTE